MPPLPARPILALEDHALIQRAIAHFIETANPRSDIEREKFARLHSRLNLSHSAAAH